MPDETAWCDGCPDFKEAAFVVLPEEGYPGDYGYACSDHVGDVMLSCVTPGVVVTRWEVKALGAP